MHVLTYTKHRWVPTASLIFSLIGGGLWMYVGITWAMFCVVSAFQLSVLLPYWRARVMNKHWKTQLAGSVDFAATMIRRLHLSTGRQELEEAIKEVKDS